jgi:hypothetical protein
LDDPVKVCLGTARSPAAHGFDGAFPAGVGSLCLGRHIQRVAATADALERFFACSRRQFLAYADGEVNQKGEEDPRQEPIQEVRLVTPSALFRLKQELARSCKFPFYCIHPAHYDRPYPGCQR